MEDTDDMFGWSEHDERLAVGEPHREREADPIRYKSIRSWRVLHRITDDYRLRSVHLFREGFFVRSKHSDDVMRTFVRFRPQNNFDLVRKLSEQ